ncbi:hypothetical protein BWI17_18120 [Betaproteobacteria bacterium GR16-43]|nr:hypothetical protein BWI17_18120 [Betaproteobacteria bacterium GR16-43]
MFPMSAGTGSLLLRYSPLIDKKQRISGIRLRLGESRCAPKDAARALGDAVATWDAHDSPLFVRVPAEAVGADLTAWKPPQGTVLEVPPLTEVDVAWAGAWNGSRPPFCASVSEGSLPAPGTFPYLSVPVDALGSAQGEPIKALCRGTKWVALEAETPRTYKLAMLRGAESASGWSFLAPPEGEKKKSLAGAASILSLLELVTRDADIGEMEAILKRDVVLAYKLVAIVNSAAMGLTVEIRSFQHAIQILGMQRLKRWLSMLLATANADSAPALSQISLTRATFLDLVGTELGFQDAQDDLFLTGAFSLLDRILGVSFEEIFAKVAVAPEVAEAVTSRTGPYGGLLKLAESLEDRAGPSQVAAEVEALALSPSFVNRSLVAACSAAVRTRFESGGAA